MIKPRQEQRLTAHGISALLELVFYRNIALQRFAEEFLQYVKQRRKGNDPFRANEWQDYIKKKDITRSNYFSILARLTGLGLIRREHGEYKDTDDFSRFLRTASEIWQAWRAE